MTQKNGLFNEHFALTGTTCQPTHYICIVITRLQSYMLNRLLFLHALDPFE